MKIVIEYDGETGHARRAWAFPDDSVAARFFVYARNTARLDCELVDAEDPVRQLQDWLASRRPGQDEEEAYAYWHEDAPPGRPVTTVILPEPPEDRADYEKEDRAALIAELGNAMGVKDGDPGDPVNG